MSTDTAGDGSEELPRLRPLAAACAAFLLFLVQPMMGRTLLPSFGGSPATWATCLVFFQATLLAGYAYAHLVAARVGRRRRLLFHAILLFAATFALPWSTSSLEVSRVLRPELGVALALAGLVGLPAIVLSATTPVLEAGSAKDGVRRLYAWSNAGSLAGLLAQPLVLEPLLGLSRQALAWCVAFISWGLLMLFVLRKGDRAPDAAPMRRERARPAEILVWMSLAAAPSALLVAATNRLTQDIAPIPLLWAAPLALYLITYIIAFGNVRWTARGPWLVAALLTAAAAALPAPTHTARALALEGLGVLAALGAAGMLCHGELARRAPPASRVTGYYLAMAAGGVLGSALVTLVAPLVFEDHVEYRHALAAPVVVVLILLASRADLGRAARVAAAAGSALLVLLSSVPVSSSDGIDEIIETRRSFFGVLRVVRRDAGRDGEDAVLMLRHGSTTHGFQFQAHGRQFESTAYYGPASGAQTALGARRRDLGAAPLRVAVVGLGVGMLAGSAEPGDFLRFYEIDPKVTAIAHERFSFLEACGERCDVITGDGRLLMKDELEAEGGGRWDVVLVDAFSGDSVPAHLLTTEFFALVREHLAPGGIAGFHVTNRYLDLSLPATALADPATAPAGEGWTATLIESDGDRESGTSASRWVLLAQGRSFEDEAIARGARARRVEPTTAPWTDERMSILSVVKWR